MKPRKQLAVCASLLGLGLAASSRVPGQEPAFAEQEDAGAMSITAAAQGMPPGLANALGLSSRAAALAAPVPVDADDASAAADIAPRAAGRDASIAEIRRALGLDDVAAAAIDPSLAAPEVDPLQAQRREALANALLAAIANATLSRRDLLPVPRTYQVAEAAARQATTVAPSVEAPAPQRLPIPEDPSRQPERRLAPPLATGPSEPRRSDVERGPEWLTVSEDWLRSGPEPAAPMPMALPPAVSAAADAAFSESMAASVSAGVAAPAVMAHAERVMQTLAEVRADELRWRGDLHAPADEAPALEDETLAEREQVLSSLAVLPSPDRAVRVDAPMPQPASAPASRAAEDEQELGTSLKAARAFASQPLPADGPWLAADEQPDAQAPVVDRDPLRTEWAAVSEGQLDGVRGGFVVDGGLRISFGIERAVYVNGSLVTTTRLNVSELGQASQGQAAMPVAVPAGGTLALIQSGAGNSFLPGPLSASSVGTVIQNSLNNQKIQNLTVIDATVNSMQILKSLNLQSALRGAVTDSLRR